MKRLLALSILAVMLLSSCAENNESQDGTSNGQSDPIYNDSAAFNSLNGPMSDMAGEFEAAGDGGYSVADAYGLYEDAFNAAQELDSYRMTASGAVAIAVEGTLVELEKSTEKVVLDTNGDFTVNCQIDLKDTHNSSVSQTIRETYGNKKAGKNYVRTDYSNFTGEENNYTETKKPSYKKPSLISMLGAVEDFDEHDIESVAVVESDGVVKLKFELSDTFAVNAAAEEFDNADIDVKKSDITVGSYAVMAVIDADGVMVAGEVSARIEVKNKDGGVVYAIAREFSVSDKNSEDILCTKPEWMK